MQEAQTTESHNNKKPEEWVFDLLRCPGCEARQPLIRSADGDALLCSCGKYSFPIRDGFPILLVSEATLLDPNILPNKGSNEE